MKMKYIVPAFCLSQYYAASLLETFSLSVSVCAFEEDFCYEKTIAWSDLISVHLISEASPHLLSQTLLVSVVRLA